MGRIDVAAVALTRGGLIAQPLEMVRVGVGEALGLLLPLGQRLFVDIERHGREGLEKRIDAPRIDRISCNILTDGGAILLPQIITDVARAPLILHHHLVAAFAAVDQPVQQRFARTRDATGFVAVIRGMIVFEHSLNLRVGLPSDVGWVDVRDADALLVLGQPGDRRTHLTGLASQRAGPTVGKGAGIGWMLENREHGRHPGRLPDQIAKAIPAGE
jgi:hypothetical protein